MVQEFILEFLQYGAYTVLAAAEAEAKSPNAMATFQVVISIAGLMVTIILFLGGIIVRSMQKDIKINTSKVDAVDRHAQEEFDTLRQIQNDGQRVHEDSERKRFARLYDKIEKEYVKKESLGLMLKNLAENVDDIKGMLTSHNRSDLDRQKDQEAKIKELSDKILKLETQLGS